MLIIVKQFLSFKRTYKLKFKNCDRPNFKGIAVVGSVFLNKVIYIINGRFNLNFYYWILKSIVNKVN